MKQILFIIASIALLSASSCSHSKKATQTAAETASKVQPTLTGTWELEFIPYTGGLDQLYPSRKPTITFDEATGSFSTFTGCNTAHGKLVKDGSKINFPEAMAMTRMLCRGEGENVYLGYLKRINTYSISSDGTKLTFIQGDMALMNFHRLAAK